MTARKVGIIGGSFDPIHNGHLISTLLAAEEFGLDEVIFIPNNIAPHKERDSYVTGQQRLAMVKASISETPLFSTSDCEIKRGGVSYTIDTVWNIKSKLPSSTKLYFIIGDDLIPELHTWQDADALIKAVQFIVMPRSRKRILNPYLKGSATFLFSSNPIIPLSSTMIRERIKNKKLITHLVPKVVIDYINENNLYV